MEVKFYTSGAVGSVVAEVGKAKNIFTGSYRVIMTSLNWNLILFSVPEWRRDQDRPGLLHHDVDRAAPQLLPAEVGGGKQD